MLCRASAGRFTKLDDMREHEQHDYDKRHTHQPQNDRHCQLPYWLSHGLNSCASVLFPARIKLARS
jgi:hypothetical protein